MHNKPVSITPHRLAPRFSMLLLAVILLAGCGSSHSMIVYPPTGTPTPRPDALYILDYLYIPGLPPEHGSSSRARRILDPVQILHFYESVNALSPLPTNSLSTTEQSYLSGAKGNLLFLQHGQPTLEVYIETRCTGLIANLYGFIPGNPPKSGFDASTGIAIPSDQRRASPAFVQMVQQAFQSGVPTPVQDIPYQPPPQK